MENLDLAEKPTIAWATKRFAETHEGQQFTSRELKEFVCDLLNKKFAEKRDPNPDTCLRHLRYLRAEGLDVICVKRSESKYAIRRLA